MNTRGCGRAGGMGTWNDFTTWAGDQDWLSIGSTVLGAFAGSQSGSTTQTTQPQVIYASPPPEKDNTLLYVALGGGALLLVVLMMNRGKK